MILRMISLVNDLNCVAIFMTGKRLWNRDPTHGAGRLITSLLTVDDAARWTLDKKTLKIFD